MKKNLPKVPHLSTAQILPVVAILVIVICSMLFVMPTYAKYKANKEAIAKERDELDKLKRKVDILKGLDENQLRQDLHELRAALPEQKNVPGLIAGLTRLAQENNLIVNTLQLRPGKIASESASQEIGVKLVVNGDLRNVDAFMKSLEGIRRVMGIQKFSGNSAAADSGFVTSLDLLFYTLPLPNQLGNFAEELPTIDKKRRDLITKLATFQIYTDAVGGASIPTIQLQTASPSATPTSSPKVATRSAISTASAQPLR